VNQKTFFITTFVKIFTKLIFVIFIVLVFRTDVCLAKQKAEKASFYRYLFELKSEEEKVGMLNQPAGIAIDEAGLVYVADTINSRIVVFNSLGDITAIFGKPGQGLGELKAPMAVTLDPKRKKVYVADSSNYRIQVFQTDGEFVLSIDLNQDIGEREKKVRPIGIAVNREGNIYVSDADNNYIRVYSSEGKFLFKFGGFGSEDGQFCIPVGLFIDQQDKIYAVDMNNSRVQVFDKQGNFLFKIGQPGDTKGSFAKPKDVCVDEKGYIYVSDGGNLVVQVFDKQGNFVDLIGAQKDVDLQFASPFGLATRDGRLYITDRWRNSIRVYEIQFQ
jgi:DNA-binding beta-propeller fold protein YncE